MNTNTSPREALALANRILFLQGVLDAFGHVSLRDPADPGRFLLARNLAPAQVSARDILAFDLEGDALEGRGEPVYLERFIHAGIYRARADVAAVVHSHSPAVVPFTVSRRARLRPVCHMSGFLGRGAPLFEIRDHAGPGSDLLVRDASLGAALAARLGGDAVVLMRGHGYTAVGTSLPQAVFRAVYAEKSACIQAQAQQLGEVTFLDEAEAASADAANAGQVTRAWDFWCLQAARDAALAAYDAPGPAA